MKFDPDDYPGEYVMHCSNREDANEFLSILDDAGRMWCNGDSYLEKDRWNDYFEDTCYYFNEGTYGSVGFAKEENTHIVLEFNDYYSDNELDVDMIDTSFIDKYLGEYVIVGGSNGI